MFLLSNSTNTEEVGSAGCQIQKMSSEYIHYAPTSVQMINYDKAINYTPSLRSFLVEYKANLTDNLQFVVASGNALLISEKLLNVFLVSNIENYQYFEADVIYHKKHYTYYFFYIYGQNYDLVDYKNMVFYGETNTPYSDFYREPHEKVGRKRKEIKVEKPEQIINWQELYPDFPNRQYENLRLNYANITPDMIRTPALLGNHYMVSEQLKNRIEEAGCTGLKFTTTDFFNRTIF